MDVKEKIRQLSPLEQEAIKNLNKLRKQVMACYSGYEDVIYKDSINAMLDAVDEAKQCLIYGYDKDGKAV